MKERTKRLFGKLAALTCGKCESCPVTEKYRCCDKMFCDINDGYLKAIGVEYEKPNVGGIPFMSEKGCVINPEHRPYCTGYVCPPHFQADREFRRDYDQIIRKINQDPDAPPMSDILKKNRLTETCKEVVDALRAANLTREK